MKHVLILIAASAMLTGGASPAVLPTTQSNALVRIVSTRGMGSADREIRAIRSDSGIWTVTFEDRSDVSGPYRTSLVLTSDQAASLEALLREPALYSEPNKVTPESEGVGCFDGPDTTTEIEFEGRARQAISVCLSSVGVTGKIGRLLASSLPKRP